MESAQEYSFLRDEFDRVTRRREQIEPKIASCRKKLYVAALASILINATGAVPEKIQTLGIELKAHQQEKLTLILGLICLYFFVEFLTILGRERLLIMSAAYMERVMEDFQLKMSAESRSRRSSYTRLTVRSAFISALEILVYYVLPIIVGIYSVVVGVAPSVIPSLIKL